MSRPVPAVHVDVTDTGTHYVVQALPWPTIDNPGQPYCARLPKHRYSADAVGVFVRKLMKLYPKAAA